MTHGSSEGALRVTALAASAQLGGTERVLLDFAARAFESDILLRIITPRGGPLIRILNELGVPAQVVEAPRSMLRGSQRGRALSTLPRALLGLRSWARRLTPHPFMRDAEVLYSIAFKTHLVTARSAAPAVWHLHEFPPALTGPVWQRLVRRVPAAVVCNSAPVAEAWRSGGWPAGGPAGPIVIPNGVDLDRFRPRERTQWIQDRLGIPRDARLIGMPAVLARWKGQLAVIDAFAQLADEFPTTHLVFAGGNIYDTAAEQSYERDLLRAIARRRARGLQRVHLLPFQPKVELVYPELDVVVHYSTRPEAFGRVVLEGMACGVPVIAAAEGGPREILTEGGWLVEPRRSAALAAALGTALRLAPETLRGLGQQGRIRAEDHYSARRFAREVARVLWGVRREGGKGGP